MKETLLIFFISLIGVIDATPPKNIPKRLMKQYTLEGKIPVVYIYLDNSYPTEKPLVYSFEEVEKFVDKAMNLDCNYYGLTDFQKTRALLQTDRKEIQSLMSNRPRLE